jgi:hypothetical protein
MFHLLKNNLVSSSHVDLRVNTLSSLSEEEKRLLCSPLGGDERDGVVRCTVNAPEGERSPENFSSPKLPVDSFMGALSCVSDFFADVVELVRAATRLQSIFKSEISEGWPWCGPFASESSKVEVNGSAEIITAFVTPFELTKGSLVHMSVLN